MISSLCVAVRPSVPKCWVDGGEAVGAPVSLRCSSDQGSAPLLYSWRRESGGPVPSDAVQSKWDLCWYCFITTMLAIFNTLLFMHNANISFSSMKFEKTKIQVNTH